MIGVTSVVPLHCSLNTLVTVSNIVCRYEGMDI